MFAAKQVIEDIYTKRNLNAHADMQYEKIKETMKQEYGSVASDLFTLVEWFTDSATLKPFAKKIFKGEEMNIIELVRDKIRHVEKYGKH